MPIPKINKQATEFQIDGETFIAVDDDSGLCNNCAFAVDDFCIDAPYCTSRLRSDKRDIVWIKQQKQEK